MTTTTATLADFLLARIAEDEAAVEGFHQGSDPEFFWGPARVRAECEAKRRVVEQCRPRYAILYRESERLLAHAFEQETMKAEAWSDAIWPFDGAEAILRALALPYADHPAYREEWKP